MLYNFIIKRTSKVFQVGVFSMLLFTTRDIVVVVGIVVFILLVLW